MSRTLAYCAVAVLGLLLVGACGGKANDAQGSSVSCVDGMVSGPADAPVVGPGSLDGTSCSTEGAMCFTSDGCVNWTCTKGEWVYCQCGC